MARRELASHGDCFVCGQHNRRGFRMVFYALSSPECIEATYIFQQEHQGPPTYAHGGSLAAVLDEIMGVAVANFSQLSLAAEIQIAYKRPVPLGKEVKIRAWVTRRYKRKTYARSVITLPNGRVGTEGKGIYVRPLYFEKMFPGHPRT